MTLFILIAGLCHFAILIASSLVPKVLNWSRELKPLHPLCRQLIWTHGLFIVLTIIAFGILSLTFAPVLAAGTPLARALCTFIGLFWLARLILQLFLFNPRPFLTTPFLRLGYHALTLTFLYLAAVYLTAVYLTAALIPRPYIR